MKTEIESKIVYVSEDGKKRSYLKDEVVRYEERQLKEIFERRTNVANISVSTSLYCFAKGDVKSFKEFHPEAYLDAIADDEEGYFVYVYDSSYDDIGENYHLYRESWYKTLVQESIKYRIDILDGITDGIMARETVNFKGSK